MSIPDADFEQLADRVAELVVEKLEATGAPNGSGGLVDAAEIARRFGVSKHYVYEHADQLGAVKLGSGPKARLRFDPEYVAKALAAPEPALGPPRRKRRRRRRGAEVELLPIGPKGRGNQ